MKNNKNKYEKNAKEWTKKYAKVINMVIIINLI